MRIPIHLEDAHLGDDRITLHIDAGGCVFVNNGEHPVAKFDLAMGRLMLWIYADRLTHEPTDEIPLPRS